MTSKKQENRPIPFFEDLSADEKFALCLQCLDKSGVMILSLDTRGMVVYINEQGCNILEQGADNIIGMDWFETHVPASMRKNARADFRKQLSESGAGDNTHRFTETVLTAGGKRRDILWSCRTRLDRDGHVAGVLCSGVDITLQEKFGAKLRVHEQKMDFALHGAKIGIWEYDITTEKFHLDPGWMRLLGYEPFEIQDDMDWFTNLIHPKDRKDAQAARARLLSGITPTYQHEYRIKAKNGTWRNVLSRGQVIGHDETGAPKHLIGTHLDITREKRGEKILQESRDRLRLALKGADLGMWDWFIPLDQVTYSERWATMLGYSPDELEPTPATFTNLLHPDDRGRVWESIQRHCKGETSSFEAEFRLLAKDGTWHWILSRGLVVERTGKGDPIRMSGTHLDITGRKESELELGRRITIEQLLASITFSFVNVSPEGMDSALAFCVKAIGRFLKTDRGYVYLAEKSGKASLRGQWCNSSEKCDLVTMTELDLENFYWLRDNLAGYLPVHFTNFQDLPEEAKAESTFFKQHKIHSFAAISIIMGEGVVGFLGFDTLEREKKWTEEEIVLLESAANVISQALESTRQAERLSRNLRVKKALSELYPPLIDPHADITTISSIVMEQAREITGSPHAFVGTIDTANKDLVAHTLVDMMQGQCIVEHDDIRFPAGEDQCYPALWGKCLNTGKSLICNNPADAPESQGVPEGHIPIQRFMSVPVILDENPAGIIALANKSSDYTDDDRDAVEQMAAYMALAVQGLRTREMADRSEARFHQVVETMSDGMVISNEYGKITYANRKFADMLGYAREEILGNPMTRFLSDRGQEDHRSDFHSRDELEGMSLDMALQTKNGKNVFCILSPATISDEKGTFQGTFCVVHDVTDRRILESQLVQAQKLESIGQLAAGIAHEINTPTQYISNNTRFLEQSVEAISEIISCFTELVEKGQAGEPMDEALKKAAETIEETQPDFLLEELPDAVKESLQGLERIAAIVQSVKKFAHPGHEGMKLEDINSAILSTVTVSTNEWKYVACVETDLDPDLPPVPCLLGEFNQVLLNLIINASHAIQDVVDNTGKKGTITIRSKKTDGYAEIRVSDTGSGIPQEIQTKIFDPFFTTKEVGRGTGQGLAISSRVIQEKHGGKLSFETAPEAGTTFIIQLPVNAETQEET